MINKAIDIQHFPSPSSSRWNNLGASRAMVLTLPRLFSFRITLAAFGSRWMAIILVLLGLVAMVTYITAVNAILLSGEALRKDQLTLERLERDVAELRQISAERESPAWVQARSTLNGMVAVTTIRYIKRDQSVALVR